MGEVGTLISVYPQRPLSACQLMTCVVGKQTGYLLGNWTGRAIKQQAFNEVPVTGEQSALFWPHRSGETSASGPHTLNENIVYPMCESPLWNASTITI